jgi:hypothetical protein
VVGATQNRDIADSGTSIPAMIAYRAGVVGSPTLNYTSCGPSGLVSEGINEATNLMEPPTMLVKALTYCDSAGFTGRSRATQVGSVRISVSVNWGSVIHRAFVPQARLTKSPEGPDRSPHEP